MPFYGCSVPAGSLTDEQKHELAAAITRIHSEVTGAAPALVHVLFNDMPSAALYSGGDRASGELSPELGEDEAWIAEH